MNSSVKGYKGFNPGMRCKAKKYKENHVYEEPKIELCSCGMHFCKNPVNVWQFYYPCSSFGELNDFAKVEALGSVQEGDIKCCTDVIKIGKKLDICDFSQEIIDVLAQEAKYHRTETNDHIAYNLRSCGEAKTTFDQQVSAVLGDYNLAVSHGDLSISAATEVFSAAYSQGYRSISAITNDYAVSKTEGWNGIAASTADSASVISTGRGGVAVSTGRRTAIVAIGSHSMAVGNHYGCATINKGDDGVAIQNGLESTASCDGENSLSIATGARSLATAIGKDSIAIAIGEDSCAMGELGSWLTLAERNECGEIVDIKSHRVDGIEIKPGTYYVLREGKFVECKDRMALIRYSIEL